MPQYAQRWNNREFKEGQGAWVQFRGQGESDRCRKCSNGTDTYQRDYSESSTTDRPSLGVKGPGVTVLSLAALTRVNVYNGWFL
jgi:hypothetical protein